MPADHSYGDSPMPVTAKLSRKFYDTFGDEIANELVEWFNQVDATYRADLLQLNELNFDRFEAKLDQHMTQLDVKWSRIWQELDAKLEQRLAQLEAKLEHRIAQFKAEVDSRFQQLDAQWERRWSELDAKLERRVADLRVELSSQRAELIKWMFVFWAGTVVPLAGLILASML
jgi:exonuclease VII large subunit